MTVLLRFAGLKERNICGSWPQLKRLIELHNFPPGRVLSPNVRAWTEAEVDEWISTRPSVNSAPLRGRPKVLHERRLERLKVAGAEAAGAKAAPMPAERRARSPVEV